MRGFTIIELSVVLVILALVIGETVSIYDGYVMRKRIEDNANAVLEMSQAIEKYYLVNRRYPCPAPLSATPGDTAYGRQMDCSNTAPGDFQTATRSIDLDHDAVPEIVRIRIGTFPFLDITDFLMDHKEEDFDRKAMRVSAYDAMDGYGRQFTYAVTERQATKGYVDHFGAIRLVDEFDRVTSDNTDFLLISHGLNGLGARLPNGVLFAPCSGTGLDPENCDGDYKFVRALQSHAPGSSYYDDAVSFMLWVPFFLWEQTDSDPNNIHNINPGNVGIGTKDPQERLHIKDGNMLSYYFGDDKGHVSAQKICAEDGSDCFETELIAGDTFPECQPDELMQGVAHSAPICVKAFQASFSNSCPADSYISGMSYNYPTHSLTITCKNPIALRHSGGGGIGRPFLPRDKNP